jgi:catechol 2,3-dioxygenase
MPRAVLPGNISLGRVRLRIANLERSLEFYAGRMGLHVREQDDRSAQLAAAPGAPPIISLQQLPGTLPRPEYAIGLYHFAILFPNRSLLGQKVLDLLDAKWPFTGFADHGVSEAAYLSDPDGNGVELYSDRPRADWPGRSDSITMYTRPLDLNNLFAAAADADLALTNRTRMGHIHLHVSNLERARQFYQDVVGFEVTNDEFPGALFLAAGGYHHHLGTNTWARRTADPDAAGLLDWLLHVPGDEAKSLLRQRLETGGVVIEPASEGWRVSDPDGNALIIM